MSPRPRILFNALPLDPRGGGVSTYVHELLTALVPVVDAVLVAAVRPVGRPELPDGVTPLVAAESHGVRRAVASARGFGPADLVHGLDVDLPVRRHGLRVATVHDMAIFDVPWAFPRYRVMGERVIAKAALRRADAVIADSQFTADRVRAICGREAVVVHLAPGSDMVPASADAVTRVRDRYALPDEFVLHVGNIEPRKDLRTLAEACERIGAPLVLTGHGLWGSTAPKGMTEIGHVPGDDLPALYGAATVVGYASRYEGFGLPPVEAMACGAAVVSTPVPAVAEVVGGGAALFEPGDVGGLADILAGLMGDARQRGELAERGRAAVAGLSWDRTAKETAEVYRSVGLPI